MLSRTRTAYLESMLSNAIADLAAELKPHFETLVRLGKKSQNPMGTQERRAEDERVAEINREFRAELLGKGLLFEKHVPGRSGQTLKVDTLTKEGKQYVADLAGAERAEFRQDLQDREHANREIKRTLETVNEDTYPRSDPETPRLMYELLGAISAMSHPNPGGNRRASLDSIRLYLKGSVEHIWWLWAEWINACIVCEDYLVAEAMLQIAWANREFVKYGMGFHGRLVAAKGVIYLARDEDVPRALEWFELARERHPNDAACMSLFRQLRLIDRSGCDHELAANLIAPRALVTQEWDHDGFRKRLADARQEELLLTSDQGDGRADEPLAG